MNNLNVCQLFLIFSFPWPRNRGGKKLFPNLWNEKTSIKRKKETELLNFLLKLLSEDELRMSGRRSPWFYDDLCWKLCKSSESFEKSFFRGDISAVQPLIDQKLKKLGKLSKIIKARLTHHGTLSHERANSYHKTNNTRKTFVAETLIRSLNERNRKRKLILWLLAPTLET